MADKINNENMKLSKDNLFKGTIYDDKIKPEEL